MRISTAWIEGSLQDMSMFARLNQLPDLVLALEKAKETFLKEEERISRRKSIRNQGKN